jgi:hypothetical protein
VSEVGAAQVHICFSVVDKYDRPIQEINSSDFIVFRDGIPLKHVLGEEGVQIQRLSPP